MTTPEVDQELERLFSVTRTATAPDAEARDRIRAAVALQVAAGGTAVAGARGFGKWKWLAIGSAVIGLGVAALWFASKPSHTVNAPVTSVQSVVRPAVTPTPPPVAEPEVATTAPPSPVVDSAAPAVPHVSARPPTKTTEPSKPEPAASTSPDPDPAAELQLVRAMQQALRSGNPSEALELAGQHAQQFPSGTLAQEREGVRAIARCQLAKPEARARILEQFSQRFGASPYAARVKAACQ